MPQPKKDNIGPFTASFLLEPLGAYDFFTPEELDDQQKDLAKLARDFFKNEIETEREKVESKQDNIVAKKMKKAGELGLLMAEIPEKYSGLGLNKVSATVIAENITGWSSFTVPVMAHTGIGTLPVLYFGTEAQRQKYLPKLATGEMLAAYALTEAGSGSDALAARTKAVLSPDGKYYILNGEKMFITNGAFADLFTVFAKVDGEKFTAFLVERSFPGVSNGKEEHKMGIHGSSTTPLILQDAKVPVENVLGEIGKGHKIAFNVLNIGRWKLSAASLGSCKRLIEYVTRYAKERKQFNREIASFQAIREKIALQGICTYLLESLCYRYAGTLDVARAAHDDTQDDFYFHLLRMIKGLNIEASITKVYGSEALAFVADEAVQIYGGYGFINEYPPEQFYRDNRINRIFEGTNEINRLLIVDTLFRRAMKGRLDFMGHLQKILAGLKTGFPKTDPKVPLAGWVDQVEDLKRATIYFAGVAAQKYADGLKEKQSLMMLLADLIIETYALESGLQRALKIRKTKGEAASRIAEAMAQVAISEGLPVLKARTRQGLFDIAAGEEKEFASYEKALDRLLQPKLATVETLKEEIAKHLLEKESFMV